MTNDTKLDEKLEGAENFRAWKYRIMLMLEEHDLDGFIKEDVKEPEEEEAMAKHKKDMIKVKKIIANSIKDQLISHVSSKNSPKEMFDSLSNMFEGKNINRRMNLRIQLRGVNIKKTESIQSYISRVSHIKEQLESIGDMVEGEVAMTTLDGLPR